MELSRYIWPIIKVRLTELMYKNHMDIIDLSNKYNLSKSIIKIRKINTSNIYSLRALLLLRGVVAACHQTHFKCNNPTQQNSSFFLL